MFHRRWHNYKEEREIQTSLRWRENEKRDKGHKVKLNFENQQELEKKKRKKKRESELCTVDQVKKRKGRLHTFRLFTGTGTGTVLWFFTRIDRWISSVIEMFNDMNLLGLLKRKYIELTGCILCPINRALLMSSISMMTLLTTKNKVHNVLRSKRLIELVN